MLAAAALQGIPVAGNSLLTRLFSLPHKGAEVHHYMFLADVRSVLSLCNAQGDGLAACAHYW